MTCQPDRRRRAGLRARLAAVTLTAALSGAGVLAASAGAVGQGVLATAAPVVYPGTSQPIDSWRLIGGGQASATQIAPRWVLASGHAPADGLWTLDRGSSGAVKTWIPLNAAGVRAADISLTLLRDPLPAPATGWPRLLTERPGDLVNVLPGHVLFAGFGGITQAELPTPKVGWATPAGLRQPGEPRLQAIGGDSGSSAFWHPTATSAPVITAISSQEDLAQTTPWTINMQRTFWSTFLTKPVGSSATTLGEWIRERMAEYPEVAPPAWVTLDEVTPLSALRPLPPTDLRVTASTATSVTLAWSHASETRAARTGYRISRPGSVINLPASSTSFRINGLTAGETYTWSVRAVNDNGESPTVAGTASEVSYAVRTQPGAVQGAQFTTSKRLTDGTKADYCATGKWTPPAPIAGTTVTGYDVTFDGEALASSQINRDFRTGGFYVERCNLDPSTNHTFTIRARSDETLSALTTSLNGAVPAGAPRGTTVFAATNVITRTKLSTVSGAVDYCLDVSWTAPTPVAGWPVQEYALLVLAGGSPIESVNGLTATSASYCGLDPEEAYGARVYANFDVGTALVTSGQSLLTPVGAPNGTPITPVTNVRAPITTRLLASSCANVTWTLPAAVDGAPVQSHQVVITPSTGGSAVATSATLSAATTAVRLCGVSVTKTYKVTVTTRYAGGGTMTATGTAAR